jgi:uncharacterized membrane protein YvbJ
MSQPDPDDEDWYDDDTADPDASVPCPECGAAIYDDSDHCPKCGHWLTDADRRTLGTGSGPSRRVRLVAILMIVIFLVTLLLAGSMF